VYTISYLFMACLPNWDWHLWF